MGLYINPMKGTKEDWLMKKGRQVCVIWPEVTLPDFKSFTEKTSCQLYLLIMEHLPQLVLLLTNKNMK